MDREVRNQGVVEVVGGGALELIRADHLMDEMIECAGITAPSSAYLAYEDIESDIVLPSICGSGMDC